LAAVDTPTKPTDDYALMEAIVSGDTAALAALYDRHSGLVFTLCLRILNDRSEAEDLLTDVFWELWSRADRYDPARGSPLTYLLTLSRSRAIDRRRTGMRHRRVHWEENQMGEQGSESGEASPLDGAISKELGCKIRAAVARLDPAQRQAVELSFFDDLSHGEIAERLGKPLGTIKTHIRQGLIRLREFVRMD
jgi:RNA polymerase sigma-70 factor, ECF subfamily